MGIKGSEGEVIVTFSDFLKSAMRHRRSIALATLAFALIGALYSLNRPVKYLIEASFKEKGVTNSGAQNSTLGDLFSSKSSSKQSEAKTWFSSRTLLKKVALRENLHGALYPRKRPLFTFPKVMVDNIKIEYGYIRKRPSPYLKEAGRPLALKEIAYSGELPLLLQVDLGEEEEYSVRDGDGRMLGKGRLGEKFVHGEFSFAIARDEGYPLEEKSYEIALSSPESAAKGLKEAIMLKTDSSDNELVHLSILHGDRRQGARLINGMIEVYKEHKAEEQKRVSSEQIAYLEERQGEAEALLRHEMNLFAEEQAKGFVTGGFANSDKALEFLSVRQQELKRRLLSIELEDKRLQKALKEGYLFYDSYSGDGDSSLFTLLMGEIRQLKQQGDSIKLSLQESPRPFDEEENLTFNRQMADLEDTRALILELKAIDRELAEGHLLRPSDSLMNDPRIMLNHWFEKLEEYRRERDFSQITPSDFESRKEQFAAYVSNLIELFEVHEKALSERLAHHGDMKEEFKGIDLPLAGELFVGYNRSLSDSEAEILKLQFLLEEMQKPQFEVNSLTSHLQDQVSRDLIAGYSRLLLDLQDGKNRSHKEQERMRGDLQRQRKFLEMHISQTLALHTLTAGLQREKINSLQKVTLALIQLKISLLEKQLQNLIASRIGNLESEKSMIVDQLTEMKREMAAIPEKKIAEQLMQQRLEKSRDFGKEITRLVESKNITNNLEVVLSKAVDEAVIPIYPQRPLLLVFTIAAAVAGFILSTAAALIVEGFRGAAASEENLALMGLSVAGEVDKGREALRRAINTLAGDREKSPLLFAGKGATSIAKEAAFLLTKRGDTTLLLSLTESAVRGAHFGLYDYLEGKVDAPTVDKSGAFHAIEAGGEHPYRSELIATSRFSELLRELGGKYDRLVVASGDPASSQEVEQLLSMFDRACIILYDERISELKAPLQQAKGGKRFTFLFIKDETLC